MPRTPAKKFDLPVQVTALDIKRGGRTEPDSCAVVRAVTRATSYRFKVNADEGVVRLTHPKTGDLVYMASQPKRVQRWVEKFDTNQPVSPISFTLKFKLQK